MVFKLKDIAEAGHILNRLIGRAAIWLSLALVLATVSDVALRYLFHAGSIKVQELEWHLYALMFLLGAGYTLQSDSHVRVDIIYSKLSKRARAVVDGLGALIFLLPFCAWVIHTSIPFVENSFDVLESSADPGGLPYRFIVKAAIPVGFSLLALQGVAQCIDSAAVVFGVDRKR